MKFSSQERKVGDFNRNMINLLREDSSFFPVWVSHDFWERLGSVQLILQVCRLFDNTASIEWAQINNSTFNLHADDV